jgi:hypothetical protein
MYEQAGSTAALGRMLGIPHSTVYWRLKRHGIPIKRTGFRSPKTVRHYGTDHHKWKGGTYMHSGGYIYEYAPEHPAACDGYVLQHRLVMERCLGRYLAAEETIHHINGDRADNRIENLEIMAHGAHMRLHRETTPRDCHGRFTAREGSTTIIGAASTWLMG